MNKFSADLIPAGLLPPEQRDQFIDWVWRLRSINMFDPGVLSYPRTLMCRSFKGENVQMYIPLQPVLMYDAIAASPDITPRQEAMGLWKIGEAVDEIAKNSGYGEVYFFCKDDRVSDICARHGFEEIKGVRVLRRKVRPTAPESQIPSTLTEAK